MINKIFKFFGIVLLSYALLIVFGYFVSESFGNSPLLNFYLYSVLPLYIAIAIGIVMFTKNTKYYRSWDGRKTAEMPSLSTEEPTFKRRLISAFIGVIVGLFVNLLTHLMFEIIGVKGAIPSALSAALPLYAIWVVTKKALFNQFK